MRMTGLAALLAGLLAAAGCTLNVGVFPGGGKLQTVVVERSPRWFERNRIALVEIEGLIGAEVSPLFGTGGTTAADVREKLEMAAADSRVRAVVLRIDSPGGDVTSSDTIYREVRRFREQTGRPVVAFLNGTAASGGYYVALAGDYLVATPTTMTGSVGVLIHYINVEGLFDKLGLRSVVIKTGERKDMGSPTRALTPEERKMLEDMAQEHFQRFLALVRDRRPTASEPVLGAISDARVLTARQALDMGLVDEVGYLDEAIERARALAGVRTADVILYRSSGGPTANVYSASPAAPETMARGLAALLQGQGPAFLYLWQPGF